MRTTTLTIFALMTFVCLQAKELIWHQGSVVLSDKQVVVGQVARVSFDLVLCRNNKGELHSFPAHKVSLFRYYDEDEDINRVFVSIGRKYYERVANGRISVFRIQQNFDQFIDESKPELFRFYVEQEKVVCSMRQFRKKYFGVIKKELDNGVVSYRHLDPNTKYGALSLIILYNKAI